MISGFGRIHFSFGRIHFSFGRIHFSFGRIHFSFGRMITEFSRVFYYPLSILQTVLLLRMIFIILNFFQSTSHSPECFTIHFPFYVAEWEMRVLFLLLGPTLWTVQLDLANRLHQSLSAITSTGTAATAPFI